MTYGKLIGGEPVERLVIEGDDLLYARETLERLRVLIDEGDEAREEALRLIDKFATVNFKHLI